MSAFAGRGSTVIETNVFSKPDYSETSRRIAVHLHLSEWGLGSVSETADGDPPHAATGCPFQAWSVAEVLRARRSLFP